MKRRHLLVLLGFGGAAAGGYYYGTDEENPSTQLEPLATPNPKETLSDVDVNAMKTQVPTEPFQFIKEPFSEPVEGTERISHVTAEPAEGVEGDRLRLRMSEEVEVQSIADDLRIVLNVGESVEIQRNMQDQLIVFAGGATGDQAALIGANHQSKRALIARSVSISSVKEVVNNWKL